MRRPESIAPFITAKQWSALRLFELEPDERAEVVGVLVAAFKDEKPDKASKTDVAKVLDTARFIAGCFRTKLDGGGFTKKVLREAEELVAQQKPNRKRKP